MDNRHRSVVPDAVSEPLPQAVDLGLADSLGSLDGVAREVVKAPDVIDYTQRENVAERLVKRFGAAIGEGSVRAMRNTTGLR